MSRQRIAAILSLLLGAILLSPGGVSAGEVAEFRWAGEDLIVRFSDSVAYTIDLAASDSSQLVVRFPNATLSSDLLAEGMRREGPRGREAVLTMSSPKELRLTVHSGGRLGYASLWRPYSRSFVVHTFDWGNLDYATEQYYKGLLAMEQGLGAHAIELLNVAEATGEERAGSLLGVYYAHRGDYKSAAPYLDRPRSPDEHAALAAVKKSEGDSAGYRENQEQFEKMLASGNEGSTSRRGRRGMEGRGRGDRDPSERGPSGGMGGYGGTSDDFETNEAIRDRQARKWLYVGGGVLLLLLLIGLAVWMARRPRRGGDPYRDVVPPPAPPPATSAEWVEVRREGTSTEAPPVAEVVDAEEVRARTPRAASEPVVIESERVESQRVESQRVEPVREIHEPQKVEQPSPVTVEETSAKGTTSTPTQAADLRRKIEEMRAQMTAPATAPRRELSSDASESTLSEARRLQLSRDSVELRRRLDRMRGAS